MWIEKRDEFVDDPKTGEKKLAHRVEIYHYTPREKMANAFAYVTAKAAAFLEGVIRSDAVVKGEITPETLGEFAKYLADEVALRALTPLVKETNLFEESEWQAAQRIAHEQKAAHVQPGAEDLPHLDEQRIKELAARNNPPATVDCGPSKSIGDILKDLGWESVEAPDAFEHFVNKDVGEVIVNGASFALRKNWDGEVVAGESPSDLQDALASAE
jgi:hypothetical protein